MKMSVRPLMKTQKFVLTAHLHMVIDLPKTEDRERVLDLPATEDRDQVMATTPPATPFK
jgi:hypothetical protein